MSMQLPSMPRSIKGTLAMLVAFAIIVVGVYLLHFGASYPLGDQATFGQFGDYIGGLINPILSFASVVILLWSVRTQAEELAASHKALQQTHLLHKEQLVIQQRESIRDQLRADAEAYLANCEKLMAKPIFMITLNQDGPASLLSLNDTFKSPAFFGIPVVNNLLKSIPAALDAGGPIGLHLNTLRTQLAFAVTSTCNLIQYLDLLALRRSWEMRLVVAIGDLKNFGVLKEKEAIEFLTELHGAMVMYEESHAKANGAE